MDAVAAVHRRGGGDRGDAAAGHHGQHHCDRRAAEDPGRAEPVRRRPQLGDHRLRADVRRADAARRSPRRHDRPQARLHGRCRDVHHRLDSVRAGMGRVHDGDRQAAAGCRRGDRVAHCVGAGGDNLPKGSAPQRRYRGVRRDDRRRLGDGTCDRRRADRSVVAAGVPGQRPDRPADAVSGLHGADRDASRVGQARCDRRDPGHARLHGRGIRLLDRPRARLGARRSPSARASPRWCASAPSQSPSAKRTTR